VNGIEEGLPYHSRTFQELGHSTAGFRFIDSAVLQLVIAICDI